MSAQGSTSAEDGIPELDPTVRAAWRESFLGKVPGPDLRPRLLSDAVVSSIPAGHVVHESGFRWISEPYPVSLVIDGVFRGFLSSPSGRQATVQYMRRGDIWGLVRTLSEKPAFEQRIRYQALVPSRLLLVRGSRFVAAVQENPALALALARELTRVIMLRTSALESSMFSDTATRIAQHIAQLAVPDQATGIPTVRLSQQELADAVGTVREVVTRIIAQFRARGIVRYSGGRLEILDIRALAVEGRMD
jgi:CRP/FNR family transcriptional regulator, cyclic AMP receptor protein